MVLFIVFLAVAVLSAAVEIFTKKLVAIFAVPAGLCAAVLGYVKEPWWVVILFFAFIFAVGATAGRAIVMRFKRESRPDAALTSTIGKSVTVTDRIDNEAGGGEILTDGARWAARSLKGDVFAKGETVRVIAVDGVRVIVDR